MGSEMRAKTVLQERDQMIVIHRVEIGRIMEVRRPDLGDLEPVIGLARGDRVHREPAGRKLPGRLFGEPFGGDLPTQNVPFFGPLGEDLDQEGAGENIDMLQAASDLIGRIDTHPAGADGSDLGGDLRAPGCHFGAVRNGGLCLRDIHCCLDSQPGNHVSADHEGSFALSKNRW